MCVCVGGDQLGVGGAGSWASDVESKFLQPCSAPTHPAASADGALPGPEALGAPRDRVWLPPAVGWAPCAAAASLCSHSTIWPLAAASPGFSHLEETNGVTNLMSPSGSWIYSRKINKHLLFVRLKMGPYSSDSDPVSVYPFGKAGLALLS